MFTGERRLGSFVAKPAEVLL